MTSDQDAIITDINIVGIVTPNNVDPFKKFVMGTMTADTKQFVLIYGQLPFFSRNVTYKLKIKELSNQETDEFTNQQAALVKQVQNGSITNGRARVNNSTFSITYNINLDYEKKIDINTLFSKFKRYNIIEVVSIFVDPKNSELVSYEGLVELANEYCHQKNINVTKIHNWIDSNLFNNKSSSIEERKKQSYNLLTLPIKFDRSIIINQYESLKKWFKNSNLTLNYQMYGKYGKRILSDVNSKMHIHTLFVACTLNPLWFVIFNNDTTLKYSADFRIANPILNTDHYKIKDSNENIPLLEECKYFEVLNDLLSLKIFTKEQVECFKLAYNVGLRITKMMYKSKSDGVAIDLPNLIPKVAIKKNVDNVFNSTIKVHSLLTNSGVTLDSGGNLIQIPDEHINYQLQLLGQFVLPPFYCETTNTNKYVLREQYLAKSIIKSAIKIKHTLSKKITMETSSIEQHLNNEQLAAIKSVGTNNIVCICGNPGNGKTFIIPHLYNILGGGSKVVVLTLIKNSIRHLKMSGIDNVVIPSSTCYKGDNSKNSEIQTIIIDDCSLFDNKSLANSFLSFPMWKKLILIGSEHTIKPIDLGSPFLQIKQNSEKLKTVVHYLTENFRLKELEQDDDKMIVDNTVVGSDNDIILYDEEDLDSVEPRSKIPALKELINCYIGDRLQDFDFSKTDSSFGCYKLELLESHIISDEEANIPTIVGTLKQENVTKLNKIINKRMIATFHPKIPTFKSGNVCYKKQRIFINIVGNHYIPSFGGKGSNLYHSEPHQITNILIYNKKTGSPMFKHVQLINKKKVLFYHNNESKKFTRDMIFILKIINESGDKKTLIVNNTYGKKKHDVIISEEIKTALKTKLRDKNLFFIDVDSIVPCWSTTINKIQGQQFKSVYIYIPENMEDLSIFTKEHGLVAITRSTQQLKIFCNSAKETFSKINSNVNMHSSDLFIN